MARLLSQLSVYHRLGMNVYPDGLIVIDIETITGT